MGGKQSNLTINSNTANFFEDAANRRSGRLLSKEKPDYVVALDEAEEVMRGYNPTSSKMYLKRNLRLMGLNPSQEMALAEIPVKRKRGRPRKYNIKPIIEGQDRLTPVSRPLPLKVQDLVASDSDVELEPPLKRKRGRPRKYSIRTLLEEQDRRGSAYVPPPRKVLDLIHNDSDVELEPPLKPKRGRPRKYIIRTLEELDLPLPDSLPPPRIILDLNGLDSDEEVEQPNRLNPSLNMLAEDSGCQILHPLFSPNKVRDLIDDDSNENNILPMKLKPGRSRKVNPDNVIGCQFVKFKDEDVYLPFPDEPSPVLSPAVSPTPSKPRLKCQHVHLALEEEYASICVKNTYARSELDLVDVSIKNIDLDV